MSRQDGDEVWEAGNSWLPNPLNDASRDDTPERRDGGHPVRVSPRLSHRLIKIKGGERNRITEQ